MNGHQSSDHRKSHPMNATTLSIVALAPLATLLLMAAHSDAHTSRIPNPIVLSGLLLGLLANTVLPDGTGFVGSLPGAVGFAKALAGAGLGLGLLLPFYLLRAMGAGDVKLAAMVGAFLGPNGLIGALLVSFVCAGPITLLYLLRSGVPGRLFEDRRQLALARLFRFLAPDSSPPVQPGPVRGARMPFGVAVAIGTLVYCVMALDGRLLFLGVF
jgi:prepilin peptidase CpaA